MVSKVFILSVAIAYVEARFGQEQVPISAISAVQGGNPGEAATIAGAAISDLLGAANACDKLTTADKIFTQLGGGADALAAAIGMVTAEKNTNPFANGNTQNVCGDASLPATTQLRGITPLIDPAVDVNGDVAALSKSSAANPLDATNMSVFDLLSQAGLGNLVASQTAGGGAAAAAGGNANNANGKGKGKGNGNAAGGNAADGNANNANGNGKANGNGNGNAAGGNAAGGNAAASNGTAPAGNANAGNAAAGKGKGNGEKNNGNGNANNNNNNNDNQQAAGNNNGNNGNNGNNNNNNGNNNNGNNNNGNGKNNGNNNNNGNNAAGGAAAGAAAGAAGATTLTGGEDFGACTPTMIFEGGQGGRPATEFTFQIADPLARGGQQEALNPNIITNALCNQLTNVCNANQAAVTACQGAKAQVEAAGTRDKSTADLFNTALGFAGAVTNPDGGPADAPAKAANRMMRRGMRL